MASYRKFPINGEVFRQSPDVSGNGGVNGTDVSQTKLQSGATVTSANFREDINVNGGINGTDVSIVKLHSGMGVAARSRGSSVVGRAGK